MLQYGEVGALCFRVGRLGLCASVWGGWGSVIQCGEVGGLCFSVGRLGVCASVWGG